MNGLCGNISKEHLEETFLRLSKLHPDWKLGRLQQRAMVEVHLSVPSLRSGELHQQEDLFKNQSTYVDCGDCPRVSTGCFNICDKAFR